MRHRLTHRRIHLVSAKQRGTNQGVSRRSPIYSMAVLKPRSRMISVRLSEDEYAALRRLCQATGARSVSDLTRDAMRGLIENGTREDALGTRMEEFRAQMKSLDHKIESLAAEITAFKANGVR